MEDKIGKYVFSFGAEYYDVDTNFETIPQLAEHINKYYSDSDKSSIFVGKIKQRVYNKATAEDLTELIAERNDDWPFDEVSIFDRMKDGVLKTLKEKLQEVLDNYLNNQEVDYYEVEHIPDEEKQQFLKLLEPNPSVCCLEKKIR